MELHFDSLEARTFQQYPTANMLRSWLVHSSIVLSFLGQTSATFEECKKGLVYRGDWRSPQQVFKSGFSDGKNPYTPSNDQIDLTYVSVAKSVPHAKEYAKSHKPSLQLCFYVYRINVEGLDCVPFGIVKSMYKRRRIPNNFPDEQGHAIIDSLPWSNVEGWIQVCPFAKYHERRWVANPDKEKGSKFDALRLPAAQSTAAQPA